MPVIQTIKRSKTLFRSKIDWWYWVVVFLTTIVIPALTFDQDPIASIILSFSLLVLWLWIIRSTYYKIKDNYLIINILFFKERIDISEIQSIKPSRSLLSSAALSIDRLEIKYGKYSSTLVSPKNKNGFLKSLSSINPSIS